MRRLALLCGLALGSAGCFINLGAGGLFGGRGPLEEKAIEGKGKDKIVLIDVREVITDAPSKRAFGLVEEQSTVDRVQSALRKAEEDDRVKAVVLRINSPGGGVTASDVIYNELLRFKERRKIPVVASLGDLAASGGYYVACAADRIVAHPTTVTGSIGVIMMGLNLEGLMGKVGVRSQVYKAGEHKDLLSPFRGATPEERRIVQGILDGLHSRFITIVRESRPKLDTKRIGELTDGRILDAQHALEAGLVEQIGDLRAAIETAEDAAGISEARVVVYHRADQDPENIYSPSSRLPMQVNLLPIELGALAGSGPRFMYLWAPGLTE